MNHERLGDAENGRGVVLAHGNGNICKERLAEQHRGYHLTALIKRWIR